MNPMPDSTAALCRRIVSNALTVDPAVLTHDVTFAKLGAGDVDLIHIVIAVESAAGAEATDDEAERIKTFGDLVRLAESLEVRAVPAAA